jgi:hypothetical protein
VDGQHFSISHVYMLNEGNGAEDCVDDEEGEAVLTIHD